MNILLKELKLNLKSLIIWCCAQGFIIFAGMMKYQGFADSEVDISALFDSLPKEVLTVLGMESVNIATIPGFYSVFFLYFMLLAAVHAIMYGAIAVSREERDHCADFIYTRPRRRFQVIAPKLVGGVINLMVFNAVTFIASIAFIAYYNDGNGMVSEVSVTMLALFFLQLFFLAIGSFFGAICPTTKIATSVSTGFVMLTFLLSVIIELVDSADFLRVLTPFNYFNAQDLVINGQLDGLPALILVAATIIFSGLCIFSFHFRDLRT
ncbi:ABC transporter permease subunit [Eubacteriaceae bacterium ES3]|nr:ABC transporter permease subunit [Eubacteriaceae bacterium ES3]